MKAINWLNEYTLKTQGGKMEKGQKSGQERQLDQKYPKSTGPKYMKLTTSSSKSPKFFRFLFYKFGVS